MTDAADAATAAAPTGPTRDFLTFWIDDQLIGIPLLEVRDVLDQRPLTRIPLAPPEVAGALNLRGRIITAIDARTRMRRSPRPGDARHMSIVVEQDGELFNILVDRVGEALRLGADGREPNPPTLDAHWRTFCAGVHRLEGDLLAILDVAEFLKFEQ